MNKATLLKSIRVNASITNVESEAFLNSFMKIIKQFSLQNNEIKITGFGKFKNVKYKKRTVKAPNGKVVMINERNVVRFIAFSDLKKAVLI